VDKPHKKLDAWKISMDLVQEVYRVTGSFPEGERFGLVGQMRRSAVSIPSNLAEGLARRNDGEIVQFIHIAMGSVSELDTQMELCRRLGFSSSGELAKVEELLARVDKLLIGLRNHIQRKATPAKAKSR
jgi:four helix bundle protein